MHTSLKLRRPSSERCSKWSAVSLSSEALHSIQVLRGYSSSFRVVGILGDYRVYWCVDSVVSIRQEVVLPFGIQGIIRNHNISFLNCLVDLYL
jgi:hypothetical protein